MKRFILLISICSVLFTSGFNFLDVANKVQEKDVTANSLVEFTQKFLYDETSKAIQNKFGNNWLFHPEEVCEKNGEKVTIVGVLNQNSSSKKLKINFEKTNSEYKVIDIREIK